MGSRSVTLRFPASRVGEPVISRLVRSVDVEVNILHARIEPSEEGRMLALLEGSGGELDRALASLRSVGVEVMLTESSFIWREERCVHCGACAGICPSGAFFADPRTGRVGFSLPDCIACGLCARACGYGAVLSVEEYVAGGSVAEGGAGV
jgi:ferredoxin